MIVFRYNLLLFTEFFINWFCRTSLKIFKENFLNKKIYFVSIFSMSFCTDEHFRGLFYFDQKVFYFPVNSISDGTSSFMTSPFDFFSKPFCFHYPTTIGNGSVVFDEKIRYPVFCKNLLFVVYKQRTLQTLNTLKSIRKLVEN